MLEVAVAVVTHDSEAHLRGLVGSLEAGMLGIGSWRLVVVDNASRDGTIALLRDLAPTAVVVPLDTNLGYGAGLNFARAVAPPHQALLALNADVRLHDRSVARLCDALGPGVGIAVPRLLEADGTTARSLRRNPSVLRAVGEAVLGGRSGWVPMLGEVVLSPGRYERAGPADWATGAAWLVSADCFEAVGAFDESYFLYSEETDFAQRAVRAGYALTYVPDARVDHQGGASGVDPFLHSLLTVNRVRCYRRTHPAAPTAAFWTAVMAGEVIRAAWGRDTSVAAVRELGRAAWRRDLAGRPVQQPGYGASSPRPSPPYEDISDTAEESGVGATEGCGR